ncbi:MAG: phosphatase PAP2 family protein [Pseudomonadota bacterium]
MFNFCKIIFIFYLILNPYLYGLSAEEILKETKGDSKAELETVDKNENMLLDDSLKLPEKDRPVLIPEESFDIDELIKSVDEVNEYITKEDPSSLPDVEMEKGPIKYNIDYSDFFRHYNWVDYSLISISSAILISDIFYNPDPLVTIDPLNFESDLADYLGSNEKFDFNNYSFLVLPAAAFYLGSTFAPTLHSKHLLLIFTEGFLLQKAITRLIKEMAQRNSPNSAYDNCFISEHTADAFYIASFLHNDLVDRLHLEVYPLYNILLGTFLHLGASFVGYANMQSGSNYLLDVLSGAALGTIVSNTIYRRHFDSRGEKKILFYPIISRDKILLSFRF